MKTTTKQLFDKTNTDLDRLYALKQQIWCNFPGSTEEERDAVLDVIAKVCNRTEELLRHLRWKQVNEL